MEGVNGMQKHRGRAGTGHRCGDFAGDKAALAQPRGDYLGPGGEYCIDRVIKYVVYAVGQGLQGLGFYPEYTSSGLEILFFFSHSL